ncbi:TRAP transporter substrate-binding protein [Paracraurococcus lichenis]|uniref:TRAP transporter substrate-binding protein n=1 Tax=Paracraurococcus lichenis TaxID=3064888 RepID=A0ABT9E4P2_9PROT|nr:TRAP transporter substrate-binding protein [Paracraurococcus sp. LOR1-02]MDO9711072.1 TRAP transporter substrate-binding protein [Paracraurococcus sp. LOR1-02]
MPDPTRRGLLAGSAALATALARPASAAPRSLRLGHINGAGSQLGAACTAFAAAVAASPVLAPVLKVEVHPNGALGGEAEMVQACLDGTLDLVFTTSVVAGALAPEAGLLDAAYLFRDKAHARAALDGSIGEEIAALLGRKNLPILAWGENGPRHVTANKPVRSPADLQGLRIRVPQSEVMLAGFRALGALPEPLAFPQIFEALRTGRFQAQENPVSTIVAAGFEKVQSHLSLTGHIYSAAFFAASGDLMEDLDEAQRAALRDCARAGARASREAVDTAERDGVAKLRAGGMTIVTDVDRAAMAAAARPALEALGRQHGADLIRRIQSLGA